MLVGIIGLSCFTVLLLFSFDVFNIGQKPLNQEEVTNLTLIVDYSNGTIKTEENFSLEPGKTTVLDALQKFCDVSYKEYPSGDVFIEEIDGLRKNIGHDWLYWVNEEFSSVAASSYELNSGDEIKWVYSSV